MSRLFLIAHLAGRPVAIDSAQVDSVVDIGAIVPVPRADKQVKGLAALRSRVVTVIDPCAALGVAHSAEDSARAVVTRIDGHHYAIQVDSLEDVAPFDMAPLASGIVLDGGWGQAGCGTVELNGEPILVVDLRVLVPGALPIAA